MNILLEIVYDLCWLLIAAFCAIVINSAIRHTGPDERDSRTRYNQTDKNSNP